MTISTSKSLQKITLSLENKHFSILPSKPGVYIFKNAQGQVIYIGKASNLKTRFKSYL